MVDQIPRQSDEAPRHRHCALTASKMMARREVQHLVVRFGWHRFEIEPMLRLRKLYRFARRESGEIE